MAETVLQPGATYKFIVRSAEEAVQTIRDRLGENVKVLSVRQVPGEGLAGLLGRPRLEVIAQLGDAEPSASPAPNGGIAPIAPASALIRDAGDENGSSGNEGAYVSMGASANALGLAHRDSPTRLPELLRRSGFSENLLSRMQGDTAFNEISQKPLHQALADVGQQLRKQAAARPPHPLPARAAFLGTPGVGRTTALCKWLAREIFAQERGGRVVKAEFDKPNPAEGLGVFCEALGLTLEYYSPGLIEGQAVEPLLVPAGDFLYADLPGLSVRHPTENKAIEKFLDAEKLSGRVLVLNAAYESAALRQAYAVGRDLGATHLVFTHLDELDHWGKLWDFVLEGELTPLFLATGPSLTGDCEENPAAALLRKTLPGA